VTIDFVTSCGPPPPFVLVLLLGPLDACWELPPVQVLATHTGTFPLTGAFTAAAGLTPADPTWPVRADCVTSCGPPPPLVLVVLFAPLAACWEVPPLQVLATHTGALPFTGALAAAAGFTLADPT
jgi:hypothetical protein